MVESKHKLLRIMHVPHEIHMPFGGTLDGGDTYQNEALSANRYVCQLFHEAFFIL